VRGKELRVRRRKNKEKRLKNVGTDKRLNVRKFGVDERI